MSTHKKITLSFEQPIQELEEQLAALKQSAEASAVDLSAEIAALEEKLRATSQAIYLNLTPWDRVQLARHINRPHTLDFVELMFKDFQELHGDRAFRDDAAIIAGTAWLDDQAVVVVGHQKGRGTKENIRRNFGYPHPEGYRKALRVMKLAQKFDLPIIALIDTPGAYPGVGSEERHVAQAIAVNIREMSTFSVPIIAAIVGEGGSGGALGLAMADKLLMLENAWYSVIAPEGCAAILWKDRKFAKEAAENLRITANELLELGVIDAVIPEPIGGAHVDYQASAQALKAAILKELKALRRHSVQDLLDARYNKYRAMGVFEELEKT